jgi:hypothetical protein
LFVSFLAGAGPGAKAEPDCYKPTGGPVAIALGRRPRRSADSRVRLSAGSPYAKRAGRYRLAAEAAAPEAFAGLGDGHALRQGVDVDVGLVVASLAGGGDRADAVLAHVSKGHGRGRNDCRSARIVSSTCAVTTIFRPLDCGRFAPGRRAGVGFSFDPVPFNNSRFMASRVASNSRDRYGLHEVALDLIRSVFPPPNGVRLVGVTLSNFQSQSGSEWAELPFP